MDYENLLNKEQLEPVLNIEGAMLVLAGAGSGKTRVLTYRIANMIEHGIAPYQILAITFTNKAAKEMKERVAKLVGDQDVWISTFHSLCARLLRYDGSNIGYGSNFSIYAEEESKKSIARIMKMREIDDKNLLKEIRWHISSGKNGGYTPQEYRKIGYSKDIDLVCDIWEEYEKELKKSNSLDFDDLLLKCIDLFKQCPDILKKYRNRFRYVLVDEFQDTNRIQYTLLRMLCAENGNLFIVGDDDQSIYGWRGAEVGNLFKFRKDFPNAKLYKLERNYRSTKNILTAANNLIRHNQERMGKELWTESDGGVRVEFRNLSTDREEAEYVFQAIDTLVRNHGYQYQDFAILMRVNSLSRLFEERAVLYGIPYRVFGGFKFYERKEIKDVIAYLRTASNQRDNESLLRILNTPKRGMGATIESKIVSLAREHNISVADVIHGAENFSEFKSAELNKLKAFAELLDDIERPKMDDDTMSLDAYVNYVVRRSGIMNEFDKSNDEDAVRIDNIDSFLRSVQEYVVNNAAFAEQEVYAETERYQLRKQELEDFLQSISLISDLDAMNDNNNVTIATIHAVKGLEFRAVFVVGLEEGVFPSSKSVNSLSEMQEERRVMYVALTRAKDRLYLTSTRSRFRFNRVEYNMTSRFVKEALPDSVSERKYDPYGDLAGEPLRGKETYHQPSQSEPVGFRPQTSGNTANGKDLTGFVPGAKVRHKTFGDGIIIEIRNGNTAFIAFEKTGIKGLSLSIAPIELVKGK